MIIQLWAKVLGVVKPVVGRGKRAGRPVKGGSQLVGTWRAALPIARSAEPIEHSRRTMCGLPLRVPCFKWGWWRRRTQSLHLVHHGRDVAQLFQSFPHLQELDVLPGSRLH